MHIVETKELTKSYGRITAVNGLNLCIEEGDIFGFLGPNGAGKTTTILMLLGLTEPTSGTALVAGYNTTREPLKVKRITGYVPENVGFYEDLTAAQNLVYTGRLNGLSDRLANERAFEALNVVGLPRDAERNVSEFSRGMKQRLAIADILVKQPKIAIMDEPTSGIDPEGIVQVLDLIARIAKETNMTIVMSSHQLYQVQRICNRVGILMNGHLVAEGLLEELSREAMGGSQFRIEVKLTEVTEAIVTAIKQINGVLSVEQSPSGLIINCSEDLRPQIAKKIVDTGGLMVEMKIQSYALEDIYLKYFREG
ncbi:MAG: ABC transporter ATP-binding protein [Dehalococcoidales bacterium]|jgi:ABC-2 type transport system ATP-binding protein|nr:ABC transporter ATP-binding protein [Dehalococcoidales bacterium]